MVRTLLRGAGRLAIMAALVSLCAAICHGFWRLPLSVHGDHRLFAATLGLAAGLLLFFWWQPPNLFYVFGHELTHWLAAKLCGRRTGRLRVGSKGGYVQVERPNLFIVLAPYCVPLYTLLWAGLAVVVHAWFRSPWYGHAFFGGLGFTYAYHLVLTVVAIGAGQSDLRVHGRAFSLLVIVAANLALLYFTLAAFSNQLTRGIICLLDAWHGQWHLLARLAHALSTRI
jgi:hypothetical protein